MRRIRQDAALCQ